jgi:hypothetical protein
MRKRQLRPEFLLCDIDHDLAGGGSVLDRLVGLGHVPVGESAGVDDGLQWPRVRQRGRLPQDLAVASQLQSFN